MDQFRLINDSLHQSCGVDQLQLATERLQEVFDSITDDPRAMSLLAKKRGQKGFREMQGEALRFSLDSTYKLMVSGHNRVYHVGHDVCFMDIQGVKAFVKLETNLLRWLQITQIVTKGLTEMKNFSSSTTR